MGVLQRSINRWEWALFIGVVLLAALLRLVALGELPPGAGYDELQDARLTERVLAGEWAIYYAENFGQEPLYPVLAAQSVGWLGWSLIALRVPGALLGVVSVAALYLAARQLRLGHEPLDGNQAEDRLILVKLLPLLAAALQTVSFWPLIETRMALETTLLPPMSALALLFLARGLSRSERHHRWISVAAFSGAGVFIGGQVYAYTPGRAMLLLVPALMIYLVLLDRRTLRRHWVGLLTLCVVTFLVVWPLFQYLRTHPQAEQRLEQLRGPLDALAEGDPEPVVQTALGTLGMFSLQGEPQWLYNIAHRPLLDPFTSFFFFVGLAVCLGRAQDWRYGLILLWLFVGLAPAFVSPPAASFTHTLIAQPAVYLILSLGIAMPAAWVVRRRARVGLSLIVLLIAVNGLISGRAYFDTWANAAPVQELYQGGVTAVAHDLEVADPPGPVAVGAPYVSFWHPWNAVGFDLALARSDLNVRWFNPGGGWVWPAGSGSTTYYFPSDPLGPQVFDRQLLALFRTDAVPQPAGDDAYSVFRLGRTDALEQRLERSGRAAVSWPPDLDHLAPPELPLDFGGRFALIGAETTAATAKPGETVRLMTYWRVLASDPTPVVAFVHLTDDGQAIWGQHDGLDVRPIGLRPGDRFVQVHPVPVDVVAPPGTYHLQVGLYGPDTLVRLQVVTTEGRTADRVWVASVEVLPP